MVNVPAQCICALEVIGNRKLLFFVDGKYNIVYYERDASFAAKFHRPPTHGVIAVDGKKIQTVSRFISGVVLNQGTEDKSEVRIYYQIENPQKAGCYLLKEALCTMTADRCDVPEWKAGTIKDNLIEVTQHSLLSAMSKPDGRPMVIYEDPGRNTLQSAFMTKNTDTGEDQWASNELKLDPDPNAGQ